MGGSPRKVRADDADPNRQPQHVVHNVLSNGGPARMRWQSPDKSFLTQSSGRAGSGASGSRESPAGRARSRRCSANERSTKSDIAASSSNFMSPTAAATVPRMASKLGGACGGTAATAASTALATTASSPSSGVTLCAGLSSNTASAALRMYPRIASDPHLPNS